MYSRDAVTDLTISVSIDLNEYNRRLLGSMEVHGTTFFGTSRDEYGMRHRYLSLRRLKDYLNRNTTHVR
jgi:hypothetical protein